MFKKKQIERKRWRERDHINHEQAVCTFKQTETYIYDYLYIHYYKYVQPTTDTTTDTHLPVFGFVFVLSVINKHSLVVEVPR
jgi:hypothetical protein